MTTPPDTEGVEGIIAEFKEKVFLASQNVTAQAFGFDLVSNEPITVWLRTKLTLIQEEAYKKGYIDGVKESHEI